MSTPDFSPQAIGAFAVLVVTNLIVLFGFSMTDPQKGALDGLINAAAVVAFLAHDAIVRHGRATGLKR